MTVASAKKYFDKSGEMDIARTLIAVVLSRFSGSQAVLTLVYGIIFGFFFSRNMWFILEHVEGKIKPVTIILFICFFLVIPFWDLTTFRFWTAAHMFMYGLLPFLFEGRKEGVIISAASILVHFAFFIVTLFISTINLKVFNEVVNDYTPEMVQEQTSGYLNKKYVEQYREGADSSKNWYVEWYLRALKWPVEGFLIVMFFWERDFFTDNKDWMSLFCFTLLFYGAANLLSSLPSGGRYITVANLSALALITLYIQNQEHEVMIKRFTWAALPALALFIIVSLRMGLYSISLSAVFGNPVVSLFFNEGHISLNEVMRMIV
jgi:hypothetical protein